MMHTPAYWRMRAKAIRTIRNDAKSRTTRACLTIIAADYDRLAKWPEDSEALLIRLGADYGDLLKSNHSFE